MADSEYCNVANAQLKDLKIAFINTIEVLIKEVNKSIKEIFEKIKHEEEMNKTVQVVESGNEKFRNSNRNLGDKPHL